jgi:hypothetical protein
MTEGMEFLLTRKNRDVFLKAHKTATQSIIDAGLNPGIGPRDGSYVPFFYECQEGDCHRSRIELHYEDRGSVVSLAGKCPTCGERIEIEVAADSPFLGEVAKFLSPRVDSRQLIIDTLVPIIAHIGGVGEAAYYGQVIPVATALSVPFPMFIKYPRVYFNTPWNEQLAAFLKENGEKVLHSPSLFKLTGKISRDRRKESFDEMNTQIHELGNLISDIHKQLNERIEIFKKEREDSGGDKLQSLKLELERYLSWTFGQYAKEKLGQESSWSWIEWGLNSSFPDMFGPYHRAYVSEMKNGATIFVNFVI